MPVVSLPLTFNNSFWTQDYRKGVEILHAKLVQGTEENSQIIAFIRARAANERILATSLRSPISIGPQGTGFDQDDGASLLVAFRGLQAESVAQGGIHRSIARELEAIVADPFSVWAEKHSLRVEESKITILDGWLRQYEEDTLEVDKLKNSYVAKRQRADELEDDAKFAPNRDAKGSYTSSSPQVQREISLSDRIGRRPAPTLSRAATTEPIEVFDASKSEAELSEAETVTPDSQIKKLDKGKSKATDLPLSLVRSGTKPSILIPSTPPQHETVPPSEPVVLLAGLAFSGAALPNLLKRAKAELPLRPVRFPILGEYEDTFTGEDFATWLRNNVPGFDGSLDRAETAARELTERDHLIRKIGEIGNKFENHPAALYQFRPKAFELPVLTPSGSGRSGSIGSIQELFSPTAHSPGVNFPLRRSNTFKSFLNTLNSPTVEPAHVKARAESQVANERYRKAVRILDLQRIALEDKIETTLKLWNRWELERLRAVKTVLLQYHAILSNLPSAYGPTLERSSTLIESYQPEADLLIAIERYRTGPFRPVAQVYKSGENGQADVVFGIDLRRWAGDEGWQSTRNGISGPSAIPPIVKGLLEGLKASYPKLSSNTERRKSWIYDVPLPPLHALREVLNGLPHNGPLPVNIFEKYDTPILAGTLKLWLLELDPPLALWEGWDVIRKLYPSVGVDSAKERNIVEELRQILGHWPMVHLLVLDAVVSHLKELVDSTAQDTEPAEVYVNKLALSVGRAIVRPKLENQYSIQDRHPTVFFIDLINHYTEVLLPTIAHKKRESGRSVPSRKRTALVDMRLHRSSLSAEIDPQQIRDAYADVQRSRSRASSPAPGDHRGIRPLSLVEGTISRSRASSPAPGDRTPRPVSVQLSDPPPRPQFKEPEPEPEEVVPSGASVIVVPPSPLDRAPELQVLPPTASSAPPAGAPVVVVPLAPVPAEEIKIPAEPPVTASVPTLASMPIPDSAPATVPDDTVIKEPSPPSSVFSTTSSRTSSPTKASASPTAPTPTSATSTFQRRGSGASLYHAGSIDGSVGGVRGPRGPRIVRGPRVANPPAAVVSAATAPGATVSNASASVASSSRSKTASSRSSPAPDRASPPRDTPSPSGSAGITSKTTLKRARPKSALNAGHLATRTMASDSEADIIG